MTVGGHSLGASCCLLRSAGRRTKHALACRKGGRRFLGRGPRIQDPGSEIWGVLTNSFPNIFTEAIVLSTSNNILLLSVEELSYARGFYV